MHFLSWCDKHNVQVILLLLSRCTGGQQLLCSHIQHEYKHILYAYTCTYTLSVLLSNSCAALLLWNTKAQIDFMIVIIHILTNTQIYTAQPYLPFLK